MISQNQLLADYAPTVRQVKDFLETHHEEMIAFIAFTFYKINEQYEMVKICPQLIHRVKVYLAEENWYRSGMHDWKEDGF